ncbi:MAG: NYN domain-containing protein [Kiritimatiellia bacterium]
MARQIMVLDAYNILHRVPRWTGVLEQSLESGREQLLGYCRRWMAERGDVWLFCVVFDGDSGVTGGLRSAGAGVRVFFSRSGQTADDRLLAILEEFGPSFVYTVVSDDHYVRDKARVLGASVLSCRVFSDTLQVIEAARASRSRRHSGSAADGAKVSPDAAARITDELRRLWVKADD